MHHTLQLLVCDVIGDSLVQKHRGAILKNYAIPKLNYVNGVCNITLIKILLIRSEYDKIKTPV